MHHRAVKRADRIAIGADAITRSEFKSESRVDPTGSKLATAPFLGDEFEMAEDIAIQPVLTPAAPSILQKTVTGVVSIDHGATMEVGLDSEYLSAIRLIIEQVQSWGNRILDYGHGSASLDVDAMK